MEAEEVWHYPLCISYFGWTLHPLAWPISLNNPLMKAYPIYVKTQSILKYDVQNVFKVCGDIWQWSWISVMNMCHTLLLIVLVVFWRWMIQQLQYFCILYNPCSHTILYRHHVATNSKMVVNFLNMRSWRNTKKCGMVISLTRCIPLCPRRLPSSIFPSVTPFHVIFLHF